MIRAINVGDSVKSCELPVSEMVLQDPEKRVRPVVLKILFTFPLTNPNIVNSSFTKVTKNNCKNFALLGCGSRRLLKLYRRVKLKHCKRTILQKTSLKKLQKNEKPLHQTNFVC